MMAISADPPWVISQSVETNIVMILPFLVHEADMRARLNMVNELCFAAQTFANRTSSLKPNLFTQTHFEANGPHHGKPVLFGFRLHDFRGLVPWPRGHSRPSGVNEGQDPLIWAKRWELKSARLRSKSAGSLTAFKGLRHKDRAFHPHPRDKARMANWCVEALNHSMGYAFRTSPAILSIRTMPFCLS